MDLEIVTASTRPDLNDEAAAFRERWPEFIFHDPVPPKYISRVNDYFADFDILVLIDGRVVAGGWGVPFVWDGTPEDLPEGYDSALVRSVDDHEAQRTSGCSTADGTVTDVPTQVGRVRWDLCREP